MKLIFRYMKPYAKSILLVIVLKLAATVSELLLPYILERLIDEIVPRQQMGQVFFWGFLMVLCALAAYRINVHTNARAVENSSQIAYDVRRDLFEKTVNLSGSQFDAFSLPSLTSRMTSDSYNVQNFSRFVQTMFVRAPIMLVGGIMVMLAMDAKLSGILIAMVPLLIAVIILISMKGIPMYQGVQSALDKVVRVMRENITGIRVVKALSKTEYEKKRFHEANANMANRDIGVGVFMALPAPMMQLSLNCGLVAVIWLGAKRVDSGAMQPGVILAFLTYFNMIMQSVMAVNRMFTMISKASASGDRIDRILQTGESLPVLPETAAAAADCRIRFDHVNFTYRTAPLVTEDGQPARQTERQRREQEQCLYDIDFTLKPGESLGIIGPTGCGKTTIINLLMRFYDPDSGTVYVDGRDVRTYDKDELHRKFGVVFQNDLVFHEPLRDNIDFGRGLDDGALQSAAADAQAAEFINGLDDGLDHMADIKGANLSGGQRQRILISRALAGKAEILVLDDASSALDYRTDAQLRKALEAHHKYATLILIAQRVSSIRNLDHILVMDNGRAIGYGSHEELLESCPAYREICQAQMGDMAGKEGA